MMQANAWFMRMYFVQASLVLLIEFRGNMQITSFLVFHSLQDNVDYQSI
jgi:hypothetical protein